MSYLTKLFIPLIIIIFILIKMGSIFGRIDTPTPKYDLIKKYDEFEIRKYDNIVTAEVKRGDNNN